MRTAPRATAATASATTAGRLWDRVPAAVKKKSSSGVLRLKKSLQAFVVPSQKHVDRLAMSLSEWNSHGASAVSDARIVGWEEGMFVIALRSSSVPSLEHSHAAIARSFDDFAELHAQILRLAKVEKIVASLVTSGSLSLPRRRLFITRAVMDERCALFELYLKDLILLPQSILTNVPACVKFLSQTQQDINITEKWRSRGLANLFGGVSGLGSKSASAEALKQPPRVNVTTVAGLDEDWLTPVEERRRSRLVPAADLSAAMLASAASVEMPNTPIPMSRQSSLPKSTLHQVITNIYDEAAKSTSVRESFVRRNFALAGAAADADTTTVVKGHGPSTSNWLLGDQTSQHAKQPHAIPRSPAMSPAVLKSEQTTAEPPVLSSRKVTTGALPSGTSRNHGNTRAIFQPTERTVSLAIAKKRSIDSDQHSVTESTEKGNEAVLKAFKLSSQTKEASSKAPSSSKTRGPSTRKPGSRPKKPLPVPPPPARDAVVQAPESLFSFDSSLSDGLSQLSLGRRPVSPLPSSSYRGDASPTAALFAPPSLIAGGSTAAAPSPLASSTVIEVIPRSPPSVVIEAASARSSTPPPPPVPKESSAQATSVKSILPGSLSPERPPSPAVVQRRRPPGGKVLVVDGLIIATGNGKIVPGEAVEVADPRKAPVQQNIVAAEYNDGDAISASLLDLRSSVVTASDGNFWRPGAMSKVKESNVEVLSVVTSLDMESESEKAAAPLQPVLPPSESDYMAFEAAPEQIRNLSARSAAGVEQWLAGVPPSPQLENMALGRLQGADISMKAGDSGFSSSRRRSQSFDGAPHPPPSSVGLPATLAEDTYAALSRGAFDPLGPVRSRAMTFDHMGPGGGRASPSGGRPSTQMTEVPRKSFGGFLPSFPEMVRGGNRVLTPKKSFTGFIKDAFKRSKKPAEGADGNANKSPSPPSSPAPYPMQLNPSGPGDHDDTPPWNRGFETTNIEHQSLFRTLSTRRRNNSNPRANGEVSAAADAVVGRVSADTLNPTIDRSLSRRRNTSGRKSEGDDDGPPTDTINPMNISGPTQISPWTRERARAIPVRTTSMRERHEAAGLLSAPLVTPELRRSTSMGRRHRAPPLDLSDEGDHSSHRYRDEPSPLPADADERHVRFAQRRRASYLHRSHSLSNLTRRDIDEHFLTIRCTLPNQESLSLKISQNTSYATFRGKVEAKTAGLWGAVSSVVYNDFEGTRVVVIDEEDWEALVAECVMCGGGRWTVTVRFL